MSIVPLHSEPIGGTANDGAALGTVDGAAVMISGQEPSPAQ
jgi:hypothetical protein